MPRMRHAVVIIAPCLLLLISAGCSNKVGQDRAQLAEGKLGLMPAATPGFEQVYVANQAEIKLAGERKISYESLESFREQNIAAAKKATEKKSVAKSDKSGGKKKAVAKKSNGRIAGIKDGLKQKFGGILGLAGVKPSAATDAKAKDTSDDSKKDEADDDSEDEDESDADDDSDDSDGDDKSDDDDSKGGDKKDGDSKEDDGR